MWTILVIWGQFVIFYLRIERGNLRKHFICRMPWKFLCNHTNNWMANGFLFTPTAFIIFPTQGFKSVFHHVLSPCSIEQFRNISPFRTCFPYVGHQFIIFIKSPLTFFNAWINIIYPVLSALFGRSKILSAWKHKQLPRDAVPSVLVWTFTKVRCMFYLIILVSSWVSCCNHFLDFPFSFKINLAWNYRKFKLLPFNIFDRTVQSGSVLDKQNLYQLRNAFLFQMSIAYQKPNIDS